MGLIASQLGNVVQSSVGPKDRSEAGGLQYTAQQLGSSLGTALIGAIVIGSLAATFLNQIENDPRIPQEVSEAISVNLSGSIQFINSGDLETALGEAGVPDEETAAIVTAYETGQLESLRMGLFAVVVVVVVALILVRRIPNISFEEIATLEADDAPNTT